jgi:hypothetical protein
MPYRRGCGESPKVNPLHQVDGEAADGIGAYQNRRDTYKRPVSIL